MTGPSCRPSMRFPATPSKRAMRSTALRARPSSSLSKARTTSSRFTNAKRSSHLQDPCRMKKIVLSLLAAALCWSAGARAADKKIVLVAGHPSHGPGDHEFNAGVQLLHRCLAGVPGVKSAFYLNGWPKDPNAFEGADTILFFMDGGAGHPIIQENHLKIIGDLMKKGVGLACVHYAVEVPKDKGGPEFLDWIGGYYEDRWSTNPHWEADFKNLPNHPVTRGVKPFKIRDEW